MQGQSFLNPISCEVGFVVRRLLFAAQSGGGGHREHDDRSNMGTSWDGDTLKCLCPARVLFQWRCPDNVPHSPPPPPHDWLGQDQPQRAWAINGGFHVVATCFSVWDLFLLPVHILCEGRDLRVVHPGILVQTIRHKGRGQGPRWE